MGLFDRLGNLLEGRGRQILYGLAGVVVVGLLVLFFVKWSNHKSDEARQALGRAITISTSNVGAPMPGVADTAITFNSETERSQRAIEEFEKVAAKYGDPYRSQARYFIASNRLAIDRQKAIAELTDLQNNSVPEVAALSKFALAQVKESDGKFDEAAQIYSDLARMNGSTVSADMANLQLAKVYEKQGKKKEAADVLFNIVDASRKAKDADNQPAQISSAAREAADELKKLDPVRYAQLPPEATPASLLG